MMLVRENQMTFLEGDKVILRPVERCDLDGPYARWINGQEADLFTEHAQFPHDSRDLESYWESKVASRDCLWLAIVDRESGDHVGNIELSGIDWVHRKAVYSILIGDVSHQGKGLGFEASRLILKHAFGKLNLNRVELGVHEDNRAAIKLYERLGFLEEGRLRQAFLRNGRYNDIVVMAILAHEYRG